MKFIISPAKSLDFETALPTTQYSEPVFLDQSKTINTTLAKKKAIRSWSANAYF